MITVRQLREAIAEIVSQIPEINKVRFVIDDDQLADKLAELKKEENTMLVCVIPRYQGFGENEDISGYLSLLQFFLVNKVDYKTFTSEEDFIDLFIKIQDIVSSFMERLFDYQREECFIFGNIKQESVVINPVRNKAQCNGWEIQLDDKTYSGIDGSH